MNVVLFLLMLCFLPEWIVFFDKVLPDWIRITKDAIDVFGRKLLIVYYENLLLDIENEIRRIVNFLHVNTSFDIDRVTCATTDYTGLFKRKRRLLGNVFTPKQYVVLDNAIKNVTDIILKANFPAPPYGTIHMDVNNTWVSKV